MSIAKTQQVMSWEFHINNEDVEFDTIVITWFYRQDNEIKAKSPIISNGLNMAQAYLRIKHTH